MVSEDTIFVFKGLGIVLFIMCGHTNSTYMICISMTNMNQKSSLEVIQSVSKLILSFCRTFQKIVLDMATEICYNI
jgi:hypothetical protein